MDWLLSEEDMDFITQKGELDWIEISVLYANGVTSESKAQATLTYCRFEYEPTLDCPHCRVVDRHYVCKGGTSASRTEDYYKCKACHRNFTKFVKTFLDNTKLTDAQIWRFAYLVGDRKIYTSTTIAYDIGITQLTAWELLQRLKKARKQQGVVMKNGSSAFEGLHQYAVLEALLQIDKSIPAIPSVDNKASVTNHNQQHHG